jgi:hypothetical protein
MAKGIKVANELILKQGHQPGVVAQWSSICLALYEALGLIPSAAKKKLKNNIGTAFRIVQASPM